MFHKDLSKIRRELTNIKTMLANTMIDDDLELTAMRTVQHMEDALKALDISASSATITQNGASQ